MNVGRGEAHGAVSILNGTFGIGCSLAVRGGARAAWKWSDEPGVRFSGGPDARVAEAVFRLFRPSASAVGADIECTTVMPPSRGLKTSSSAAVAMVRAVLNSFGHREPQEGVVALATAACLEAGVTLTGARDDQTAVALGGCRLVEQCSGRLLRTFDVRAEVAIWVPDATIAKSQVPMADPQAASAAEFLARSLQRGSLGPAEVLTASGVLFTELYAGAGLPVNPRPAEIAIQNGALGAGLSGTGPAVAALFEQKGTLPDVAGGRWVWTEAVA